LTWTSRDGSLVVLVTLSGKIILIRVLLELSALDGVSLGKSSGVLTELGHDVEKLNTGGLHDGSESPGSNTETDGGHVHAESERGGGEKGSSPGVTNHEELNVELTEEDDPEPEVLEWSLEDVELTLVGLLLIRILLSNGA